MQKGETLLTKLRKKTYELYILHNIEHITLVVNQGGEGVGWDGVAKRRG